MWQWVLITPGICFLRILLSNGTSQALVEYMPSRSRLHFPTSLETMCACGKVMTNGMSAEVKCTASSHIIGKENTCIPGASLVVQWVRLHTLNTRGPDLILGQETRTCMLQLRPGIDKKKKMLAFHPSHLLQAGIWWVSGKLASVNHVDENNIPEERRTVDWRILSLWIIVKGRRMMTAPDYFPLYSHVKEKGIPVLFESLYFGVSCSSNPVSIPTIRHPREGQENIQPLVSPMSQPL